MSKMTKQCLGKFKRYYVSAFIRDADHLKGEDLFLTSDGFWYDNFDLACLFADPDEASAFASENVKDDMKGYTTVLRSVFCEINGCDPGVLI